MNISDCGQIIHSHGNAPRHPYHTMCVQFVIIKLYEERCSVCGCGMRECGVVCGCGMRECGV